MSDKIWNPETKRYVARSGKKGKEILAKYGDIEYKVEKPKEAKSSLLSEFIRPELTPKKLYHGSYNYEKSGISYILSRHHDVCVTLERDMYIDINKCGKIPIKLSKSIETLISKCRKRFIAIYVNISCGISHANMMIIDTKNKTAERFEPFGQFDDYMKLYDMTVIDDNLAKTFKTYKLKYISPLEFCPNIQKIQELEKKTMGVHDLGFCASWSLFYADLRLSYPDIQIYKLLSKTVEELKKSNTPLTNFIRNYGNFILNEGDPNIALYIEVDQGNYDNVKKLIKAGAKITQGDQNTDMVLATIFNNDAKMLKLLLDNGADKYNVLYLPTAYRIGNIDIIKLLLTGDEEYDNVTEIDEILDIANKHPKIFKFLVKNSNISVDLLDKLQEDYEEVAELLR